MSSNPIVIRAEGVGKCYSIYDVPSDRLKQTIMARLRSRLGLPAKSYYREFWALNDLSFEVGRGETVGLIGLNGSGKSTLLQIIAGTLMPTTGQVDVRGRVAALLELGAGFNPEFSGRENVYLNAALLGLSREQTEARFDEIAAFADIGEFLDRPVKTYSSGMYVRLAFAVSVCVEPDILIVDEALAVGDAPFRFKCLKRIEQMQERGVTLMFVSHDMSMVQTFCQRAIYLECGRLKSIGDPEVIATQYAYDIREQQRLSLGMARPMWQQPALGTQLPSAAFGTGDGKIVRAVFSATQTNQESLVLGESIEMEVEVDYPKDREDLALAVVVQNERLLELIGKRIALPRVSAEAPPGPSHIKLHIQNPLTVGHYFISLRLVEHVALDQYIPLQSQIAALHFHNAAPPGGLAFLGQFQAEIKMEVRLPRPLRIIALLAVRNEVAYLERCLRHLAEQGILAYVIDNGSTDGTVAIVRQWQGRGVVIGIEDYPYPGYYDWQGLLARKAELAQSLEADWFIHHDADEIRQSRVLGETLAQAIARLDARGFNAIDFDEFVYLPLGPNTDITHGDYVAELSHAYHFAPEPLHRVNAWKKTGQPIDLISAGGHQVKFEGQRIANERFVLRHYPFLSRQHLLEKYTRQRVYSDYEVNTLGWHGNRASFSEDLVDLPAVEQLLNPDIQGWDTNHPWREHPFLGGKMP